jgi:acyl-CoA dehydrogenase
MNFAYTPRLLDLKRRAIELTERILPYEEPCEENNGLPPEALADFRRAVLDTGLQAVNMPAGWGGAGLTVLEQVVVQGELGKLTNALWDAVWRPANALRACTPEQRERWLIPAILGDRRDAVAITEAHAGSDPRAISTNARRDGDGYRIDGEKWFVTVGDVADFLFVLASVRPGDQPTLFLVDKDLPGVRVKRIPRYTHTFVYEHPEFVFEDVRVGRDAVLGGVGGGYELTRDWFTEERLMIGARTIGAAERALALATDWARARVQGGERLIDRQLIQAMLADCAIDIATNRAHPSGRVGVRPARQPQDAPRQGRDGQARCVRGFQPRRRSLSADLRRARLHARLPGGAALAGAARGPHLGGDLGDPAPGHRQRDRQARAGRPPELRQGGGGRRHRRLRRAFRRSARPLGRVPPRCSECWRAAGACSRRSER